MDDKYETRITISIECPTCGALPDNHCREGQAIMLKPHLTRAVRIKVDG